MPGRSAKRDDRDIGHRAPLPEWITGLIGVVLVAAAIGILVYEAFRDDVSPPSITVEVTGIHLQPQGWLVEVRVRNDGGTTAAMLSLEGTLEDATRTVETSEATIDYVPAHSERMAGLYFSRDPREFRLAVRPTGYQEP